MGVRVNIYYKCPVIESSVNVNTEVICLEKGEIITPTMHESQENIQSDEQLVANKQEFVLQINSLSSKEKKLMATVTINDMPIVMQTDTAADVSDIRTGSMQNFWFVHRIMQYGSVGL